MALRVEGGTGEGYEWSLAVGALPDGIAGLPAAGATTVLAGVPREIGDFGFTVEVRDSALRVAQRAFSIRVTAAPEVVVPSWTPVTNVHAPLARSGHSAVWTGDEMIVWGGFGVSDFLDSGAAYDPRLGAWRAITSDGAPQPRLGHTAVWTGAEMIVWGGQGDFAGPAPNTVDLLFGNGAAYDPDTDRWQAIATPDALAARGHTAAWTGDEMLVWGGRNALSIALQTLDVGGAYAPASDSWSDLPAVGAPAPRVDHTAVWTGFPRAEMIVWGGSSDLTGPSAQATGGLFSPVGASWRPTSTLGAPTPRAGHTAIWTGAEMLVWGGSRPGDADGTGGAYDPGVDAPGLRHDHPRPGADRPGYRRPARTPSAASWTNPFQGHELTAGFYLPSRVQLRTERYPENVGERLAEHARPYGDHRANTRPPGTRPTGSFRKRGRVRTGYGSDVIPPTGPPGASRLQRCDLAGLDPEALV